MDGVLRTLLWNPEPRRLRLPWRLLSLLVVLTLFGVAASIVSPHARAASATVLATATSEAQAVAAAGTVGSLVSPLVVYGGAVYLVGRFVDRRYFSDFGLALDRAWWTDLGFGLALGTLLMTGVFLVELAAGWVTITGGSRTIQSPLPFWPRFARAFLTMAVIGITEELVTRGYLLTNLAEGLTWFDRVGSAVAVVLAVLGSALVFSWAHLANPNASLASGVGIFVGALMLASGYVLTGDLAIPIGLHVSWNFVQGPVFGFPVSGVDFGVSLLAVSQRGPAVVTGGPFGPEAGVLGVAASVVGIGLIAAWAWRREGRLEVHPSITTPDLRREDDG